MVRAQSLVLHQVEHVLVPGHKIIGVRGEGQVEIRLVVRIAGEGV